ncbi:MULTISPECIES: hypothetical protein [Paenibacillus]|uniref:hypothetical protein n=1 Tax=Paenibacillus TaxID=44249 RepID=UPI002FE01532
MKKLPSGLNAFEPSDAVRREAQNANIEVLDRLFNNNEGHRHTGKPGDAPPIGREGIESGALERQHFKNGRISENVAKFKPVTVTDGSIIGLPTAPYYKPRADSAEMNCWYLAPSGEYPASLTINLEGFYDIEAIALEITPVTPLKCKLEISTNQSEWKLVTERTFEGERFVSLPKPENASYVRITVIEPAVSVTRITRLAVYSSQTDGVEYEPLEDRRAWGLVARLQGLITISSNPIIDNEVSVTLSGHVWIMNPIANAYLTVYAGTYPLVNNEYLYIDLPYFGDNTQGIYPKVGKPDYNKPLGFYAHRDRLILMYRGGDKQLYLNFPLNTKLQRTGGIPMFSIAGANLLDADMNIEDSMRYADETFTGTMARLKADKDSIAADGSDVLTVDLSITDWQGNIQEDFNEDVQLEMNGIQQAISVSKGKAALTVSSEEPGEFRLSTLGLDRNAGLKVVVTDGK